MIGMVTHINVLMKKVEQDKPVNEVKINRFFNTATYKKLKNEKGKKT